MEGRTGSLQERLDHAVAHPRLRGPSRTHQPRRSHGQQRTSRRRRRRDCRLQRRTVVGGRRRAGTAAVGRRGPSAETRCERNGRRRRREMCHCCVVREEQLAQEKTKLPAAPVGFTSTVPGAGGVVGALRVVLQLCRGVAFGDYDALPSRNNHGTTLHADAIPRRDHRRVITRARRQQAGRRLRRLDWICATPAHSDRLL